VIGEVMAKETYYRGKRDLLFSISASDR